MASSSANNAPGAFVAPPSFAEHSKSLAEWFRATIIGTTEFDAATTQRLRLALVAYTAAARAHSAEPDHSKVTIPDIIRAALKIGKDSMLANDPRWPTLVAKTSENTSARQDVPKGPKSVPTVDKKGKKRMMEDEHTESRREGGEEKRRKHEGGVAFEAGKEDGGGVAEIMANRRDTQEVWVEIPPLPYRRADSVKRKEKRTRKRLNTRVAEDSEEEDLVRVKQEHEASGDETDVESEDQESDEPAHAPSSRVQRPRRSVKDIGYVEVSDEEPPKKGPPKTTPRRVAHPAPALKPSKTVVIDLSEELDGICKNCEKNGLFCFTEWNNVKSTQTACGYCHGKKIRCSLAPVRSDFMKSDAGQAFYKTVTGKAPKPAPKKRAPSEGETIHGEGPALAPKGGSKSRASKVPKPQYKTPSVVPSDTEDYTDAPKAKRVRLVDTKETPKPGKATTRAPLSKQNIPTPPLEQKSEAPVARNHGTARPLSAQARRVAKRPDVTAESDEGQGTRPSSEAVSATAEPDLQTLHRDVLELRRAHEEMKLFISDQQASFREIIQLVKLDIKDLYTATKRLNSDFAKNYEYTDRNTKAIKSIKSSAVSVKSMRDFSAELKDMGTHFVDRFEKIECTIDEILYNAGALEDDEDSGGSESGGDNLSDQDDGDDGGAEDSDGNGDRREDHGSNDKSDGVQDGGNIHEENILADGENGGEQKAVSVPTAGPFIPKVALRENPVIAPSMVMLGVGTEIPTTNKSVGAETPTTKKSVGAGVLTAEPTCGIADERMGGVVSTAAMRDSTKMQALGNPSLPEAVQPAEEPHRPSPSLIPVNSTLEHLPKINVTVPSTVGGPQPATQVFSVPTVTISIAEVVPKQIDLTEARVGAAVQVTTSGLTVPTPEQIVPSSQEGQDGLELNGLIKANTDTTRKEQPPVAELSNHHPGNAIQQTSVLDLSSHIVSRPTMDTSHSSGKSLGGRAPQTQAASTTVGPPPAGSTNTPMEVQTDIPRRTRAMTNSKPNPQLQPKPKPKPTPKPKPKPTPKPKPKPTPKPKQKKEVPRTGSSSLSPPP